MPGFSLLCIPCLIFSYFMSFLAALQSSSPVQVVSPHSGSRTEAGQEWSRGQEDAETWCCLFRQSKGQQQGRGPKLCLFACVCCPCTGLSVSGVWKPHSCVPTVLLGHLAWPGVTSCRPLLGCLHPFVLSFPSP